MSVEFAEKILDSMVDEEGNCGARGLSPKQFNVLAQYLTPGEWKYISSWCGSRGGHKEFYARDYIGNIGKYYVELNWYAHFHDRYTVKSICLRDEEEYRAEIALKERLKKSRDFSHSEWQFEPKERKDLVLTLVYENDYLQDSYRGYGLDRVNVYTFADDNGNCFVWKTTSFLRKEVKDEDPQFPSIGDRITMKATIKGHSEYRGVKQTVIIRPKVEKISPW